MKRRAVPGAERPTCVTDTAWEAPMSSRPVTHLSAEQSIRSARAEIAPTHLLAVDVDRPKRIDRYIDYFGSGGARRTVVSSEPCGESLLDVDGAPLSAERSLRPTSVLLQTVGRVVRDRSSAARRLRP